MKAVLLVIGMAGSISGPVQAGPIDDRLTLAQQQSKPAEVAPREESAQPQSGQNTAGKNNEKRSKDRFKPSERIRADSPVSFPVDI